MPPVRIGVLATQGGFAAHTRLLAELGVIAREVRTPGDLDVLDGLIIPGGESTTMALGWDRDGMWGPLRGYLASGRPVLGTCAGLIMLANRIKDGMPGQRTLGGLSVTVRRNGYGPQAHSAETDVTITGHPHPARAVFIRAPVITRVSGQAEILATCGSQPVAVRQDAVTGVTFHPELAQVSVFHQQLISAAAERAAGEHACAV